MPVSHHHILLLTMYVVENNFICGVSMLFANVSIPFISVQVFSINNLNINIFFH